MKPVLLIGLMVWSTSAMADGYGFMTPSGNIYCNGAVEISEITCSIVERNSPPASPRPASCSATWGHTFTLRRTGPVIVECSAAPSRVNYTDIAPYGVSASFGDIHCTSQQTGLTCRNASGNGFTLARRGQSLF